MADEESFFVAAVLRVVGFFADAFFFAQLAGLLTHPGSEMAGGILIERAVQTSDMWGRKGKLHLHARDEDAREAYRCLGFEGKTHTNDMDMALDPEKKPDIWSRLDSKWRLKKHHGMKYIG